MTTIFAEDYKTIPYWWEAAEPRDEPAHDLPAEIDVVVVGSGFAGLSTALELARNGTKVVVIEAERLGHGASTRNGGQVSGVNVGKGPSSGTRKSPAEESLGKERLTQLIEEATQSVDHLVDIIAREGIDCDLADCGRFVGAFTRSHYNALGERAEVLTKAGNTGVELLPRNRQREEIGTDFYHGGLVMQSGRSVHPAKLHGGLLDAAIRAGVTFCPMTKVTAISRGDGGFTVTTDKGVVKAREVVAGTNGYTGAPTPWVKRRLIPAASYIIATEPLAPEVAQRLVPNNRSLADTKRVLNYFRLSPDRTRMLFGGRARLSMGDPTGPAQILYRQMTRVFPELEGTRITHAWTGGIAFTFDFLPHMGTTPDGVHYLVGCNGSGVAMMNHLGHQTALKILGRQNRPSGFDGLPFPTKPFYDGTPWFLPVVSQYYGLRDRIDRLIDG